MNTGPMATEGGKLDLAPAVGRAKKTNKQRPQGNGGRKVEQGTGSWQGKEGKRTEAAR